MTTKIMPNDPALDDVDNRLAGRITNEQEAAIVRMVAEFTSGTMGVTNGSNMDTGKTLQASEVVIRMGLQRVLYIGVKDTFAQWAGRLSAQSDGQLEMRRIDASVAGQQAWDAFYAGEPGHYFTGSQYLTAQDWEHLPAWEDDGVTPKWKLTPKSKGAEVITTPLPDGVYGPEAPKRVSVRQQKNIFRFARFTNHPLDMIVFDEVHAIANRKSIGRKTLMKIPTLRKLGMSGTWVGGAFQNAWSITEWVWRGTVDPSFIRWAEQWCETKTVYLPGAEEKKMPGGERSPGTYVTTLPCYIRLNGELEVPVAEEFDVELTPAQRNDYDDLERDLIVWLNGPNGQRASLVADLPIVLRTHLRSATLGKVSFDADGVIDYAPDADSSKLWALRQIVDRPDWAGRQVGIYTHSKKFAKLTVARMRAAGYNAVEWSGDVTSKERDAIKAAFLAGEIQYLVSVIAAFSTGLDGFQAVCNRLIWLSESDNEVLNQQAVRRYFRSGNPEMLADFQHVKILANNTYDRGVLSKNAMSTLAMRHTLAA